MQVQLPTFHGSYSGTHAQNRRTASKLAAEAAKAKSQWKKEKHTALYESRGAQYANGQTTFRVFAPHAKKVSVCLTAFGAVEHTLEMKRNRKGEWEVTTNLAQPGRAYLYQIKDANHKEMLRTDPVSFTTTYVSESDQVQSLVKDRSLYQWGDQHWMEQRAQRNPLQAPLSIYEIQPKSWKSPAKAPLNFREMAPELIIYCKKMGFTHVECYGLLDHYWQKARGYQVSNYFAPFRNNGDIDDLKYLVDQLHRNGIGIILDWVPTHFQHYSVNDKYSVSMHEIDGTNLYAAEDSIWNTRYLDYGKEETRRFLEAGALYFLDELHFDGLRFDAISQLVHRNGHNVPSGISFLKELNDTIHRCYPGVMTIAEETEGFPNVTIPTNQGGLGFDLKWNIGWSHDSRNFLKTPYAEKPQHWHQKVVHFLNSASHGEKQILTHSHDDTDDGDTSNQKVLLQCVSHLPNESERFANLRNFFAWQTLAPSYGHMVHMGDDNGQNESWYQRLRKGESSVDWQLTQVDSRHQGVQECVSDLNALYKAKPQFWERGAQNYSLISEYGPNGIVAYHRGTKDNQRLAVIHNFSDTSYPEYDIPLPRSSQDYAINKIQPIRELFNSDHFKYGGSGNFLNGSIAIIRDPQTHEPTHLRMALPAASTVVLEEQLA